MGALGSDAERLRAEYDDQTDSEFRTEIYRQLEWVRFEKRWKPGWTARTYRELFGRWPEKHLSNLRPVPASEAVEKFVRRKLRRSAKEFKEAKERERNGREQVSGSAAPTQEQVGLHRGNGKVEG